LSGIQIKTKWNNSIKIFINKDMAYMRTLQGMASSSGFAVGITCVYSDEYEESVVSHYNISEEQVSNEIARLKEGFEKAKSLMQDIIKVSEKFSDKKVKEIFNTHLMILNDPELFEKMSGLIKEKKINAEHAVADVFEDSKGNIWIGTFNGGVSKYDGSTFSDFTKDGIIDGPETYNFCEDNNGNIWFSAENYGVYRYDGEEFTQFTTKEGLATNTIQNIFEDNKGQIWFSTWEGISLYDGKEITNVSDKEPWTK